VRCSGGSLPKADKRRWREINATGGGAFDTHTHTEREGDGMARAQRRSKICSRCWRRCHLTWASSNHPGVGGSVLRAWAHCACVGSLNSRLMFLPLMLTASSGAFNVLKLSHADRFQ
jgi:hypothetical protein